MVRIVVFLTLFTALNLNGQKAIGTWTIHAGYYYPQEILEIDSDIVFNGNVGLLFIHPSTEATYVLDKSNGLSEVGISKISYHEKLRKLIVVYENSNIDIIDYSKGKEIFNLNDIKQKIIIGDKKIYDISFLDNKCYLSTGFGIVVFDLKEYLIRETYKIGISGENWRVNNLVFYNNKIVAATEKGIRSASLSSPNLQNFFNWSSEFNTGFGAENIEQIKLFQNNLFALKKDTIFQWVGNSWKLYYADTNYAIKGIINYSNNLAVNLILDSNRKVEYGFEFLIINPDLSNEKKFTNLVSYPSSILLGTNGNTFIGGVRGVHEIINGNRARLFYHRGPGVECYQFSYSPSSGYMYVSTGTVNPSYNNIGYFLYDGFSWENQSYADPKFDGLKDNMAVAYANNKLYLANNIGGLAEYDNQNVKKYNETNSILEFYFGDASVRIIDAKADKEENIWMLNYFCANPLKVLTKDGKWYQFNPLNENKAQQKLLIDKNNNKWIIFKGDGIMVFNEGKNMEVSSDDKAIKLNVIKDKCEISNVILDMVEDKEGAIWCGTDKGIQVFNCGSNPFNGNCKSYAPIIKKGDGSIDPNDTFIECLLSYEVVSAIAVDGGNRKWCGTSNGIFLISADGKNQIEHFTTENSPLPSNQINDIFVNPANGDVFIGTSKGIISYRGTATDGTATQEKDIFVYPNPVEKDFVGNITVDHLVDNATVKITDISGRLVYESKAQGGRMVWNGVMYNGKRPHSGVYMIFVANEFGEETGIARIVFKQ